MLSQNYLFTANSVAILDAALTFWAIVKTFLSRFCYDRSYDDADSSSPAKVFFSDRDIVGLRTANKSLPQMLIFTFESRNLYPQSQYG